MEQNSNALNWFEIPVADINRAKTFYNTIFDHEMVDMGEMMGLKMAGFPTDSGSGHVSGGLVEGPGYKPSSEGAVVYLNANPDMQTVLDRIEGAGGQVLMPKTQISPEIGSMAFFIDSEGNKVALHSNN
jgi:predicted enzyme related to lactoylglutathione lyase